MKNNDTKNSAETLNFIKLLPLFKGADESLLSESIEKERFVTCRYRSGETIYSPCREEKRLIIMKNGNANVYSADESRSLLLRRLEIGRVVGVANLFSDERYVSRIIADKRCETIEINADDFASLLERDGRLMRNYISFLSNKICLLNKKIVYLTAGSAERRLATFLDAHSTETGEDTFSLSVPMNSLCEMLNLGRASLYRAVDKLEADGCIKRDGKQITIINKELLLSIP